MANAAYKFNNRNKVFLTYDDEKSVAAKSAYVKEKGLNGIFFWELRLDIPYHGMLEILVKEMHK